MYSQIVNKKDLEKYKAYCWWRGIRGIWVEHIYSNFLEIGRNDDFMEISPEFKAFRQWLVLDFKKSNHNKYRHLADWWMSNLTVSQLIGLYEQYLRCTK